MATTEDASVQTHDLIRELFISKSNSKISVLIGMIILDSTLKLEKNK